MRKPYIAGNWKMNLDRRGALDLAGALREHVGLRTDVDVAVFPPSLYLEAVVGGLGGSPIAVGSQNTSEHDSGAYTGEISVGMVKDIGATIALLGHSERRHVYGETDAQVNAKVKAALAGGLDVMLCIGETIEEREAGDTEKVCARQLTQGLAGVDANDLARVSVAYEPVWAIGTGLTATPEQAGAVHAYVRGVFAGLYSDSDAAALRILYGGSVKPDNVGDLMAVPDIDGALVGGASLKPELFIPIVELGK